MLPFVCQRGSLGKKGEKSESEQIECSKYVGGSQSATRQCSPGKNLQRPNPNKSGLLSQLAARQLSRTPPLDHLAAPPYMLSDPNAKIEPAVPQITHLHLRAASGSRWFLFANLQLLFSAQRRRFKIFKLLALSCALPSQFAGCPLFSSDNQTTNQKTR